MSDILSKLLSKLSPEIEKKVQERMTPILDELREMHKTLQEIRDLLKLILECVSEKGGRREQENY